MRYVLAPSAFARGRFVIKDRKCGVFVGSPLPYGEAFDKCSKLNETEKG